MCWTTNKHMIIIHSKTISNTIISDTLGRKQAMLTAMVVTNDFIIELQRHEESGGRNKDMRHSTNNETRNKERKKKERKKA